jgi:hypothetical protein
LPSRYLQPGSLQGFTKRRLLLTREIIRNFAVCFVKKEVEMSWVLRFLHQQKDQLTAKWTTRMDRNRHQANSESKYTLYFNLLHQIMQQYDVEPENTYDMDKKGFLVGTTSRSKRVFSKALFGEKRDDKCTPR